MNATKRGKNDGVPLDPLVVKGVCQCGYFSLTSLQQCSERSELMLRQKNRIYEEIWFVLATTKENDLHHDTHFRVADNHKTLAERKLT